MNMQLPIESLSTSLSLLGRVRLHENEAWERFARLYGPLVYSWSRRSGLQDSDAADVTQEVFVILSHQIDRFDQYRSGAKFRAWLWGIVRNKLKEHGRVRRAEPMTGHSGDRSEFVADRLPSTGDPTAEQETKALANRALELIKTDFAPQTWEIFWRVTMVGDRPAEVATELGVSVASVYTAKSRVLKHLRTELVGLIE